MQIKVFPLDESPGFLIHRLDSKMASGLQRKFSAQGFDITPEQWGVLSRLWEEDGIHQTELAARTSKDRHNITRILKLMEKNGFIIRKADPEDKRRQRVFLSEKGRRIQDELTSIVMSYLKKCFSGLNAADIRQLRRLHEHILRNLEK